MAALFFALLTWRYAWATGFLYSFLFSFTFYVSSCWISLLGLVRWLIDLKRTMSESSSSFLRFDWSGISTTRLTFLSCLENRACDFFLLKVEVRPPLVLLPRSRPAPIPSKLGGFLPPFSPWCYCLTNDLICSTWLWANLLASKSSFLALEIKILSLSS